MLPRILLALAAVAALAGCAGDDAGSPTPPASDVPPTPTPTTPGPVAPTAPSQEVPPEPAGDDAASAEGYVAPVFEAEDAIATAADPAAFADVNPIDYRNPWR